VPLFGIDISHHQSSTLNMAQCRREGIEFIFLKATEGSSFVDSAFTANLSKARAAGLLVAAYHYVRSNATAAAQVANVVRVVPKDVPVIPDVEANSGGIALVRDVVNRLQQAGYHVPLTYLPRWYWQQLGEPSLAGLPSLWSSRYPDNVIGSIADEFARVPASYWNGYGGLGVTVLQFTSSARVAGHQPLDGNAFIGTREQLAAVLGQEDDDMQPSDLVINPATGQPALDINGKTYTYGQAWYYDNLNGWAIRDQLDALAAEVAELKARPVADVDEEALAAELEARGIVGVTPQQVKEVIQAVFRDAGSDAEPPVTGV
jgi:lysozyme